MEQVHGVDVRWMTQGSFKEKFNKPSYATNKTSGSSQPRQLPTESQASANTQTNTGTANNGQSGNRQEALPINGSNNSRRQTRSGSIDKTSPGPNGTPPHHRRNSWFSNISAKFSGSSSNSQAANAPAQQQAQTQPQPLSQSPTAQLEPVVPKITANRNAVLQHGLRPEGDGPYTPAPPKSGQAGFLGVFRRLSTSGTNTTPTGKLAHGLVERRILNVDRNRDRCPITELKDNKLRRVSFCVDVEIAPMPKYIAGEAESKPIDRTTKKIVEKGEGEALKNPKAAEAQKEAETDTKTEDTEEPKTQDSETGEATEDADAAKPQADEPVPAPKEMTRKKEKKKRSEEERKARKEKRRKLAEANGSVPVEIHYDSSDSSSDSPSSSGTPKTTSFPTINPVRIYRRCCQLRETPILKKITEQLGEGANTSATTGFVNTLDLSGYFMQLPDLITLGDYLAVVPVREVILDNSGLTDEGLRVILAGLLASKQPGFSRKKNKSLIEHHGVVERLSLKENNLGIDGWKHISLFIYMCRSLKQLDVSNIPFPRQPSANKNGSLSNGVYIPLGIADVLAKSFAERPAGSVLEIVNIGEIEPSMEQFGTIIDGLIQCGVSRLGVANNHLDRQGLQHIARYLEAGKCEGLDLGGIDLRDDIDIISSSIKENHPLWAISLAGCNLAPASLCKIFPVLTKLQNLRFIDLSHNHDLFDTRPSAVGALRRYLPQMEPLKRIHLQDVNMTAEQAIAIVEVVPEVHNLCHMNLLGNAEIVSLADAKTEEAKEEACALYASLMAATRISKSMICVDIEVPSAGASEIVKAMAKQVVAYCLRNLEQVHDTEVGSAVASALAEAHAESQDSSKPPSYPDVLAHLVGHDVLGQDEPGDDDDATADEDYVIGGTGVVKALTFCFENRGDDSRRQSGEFGRAIESNGVPDSQGPKLPTGGKAKDLSKHLLAGARKIRHRLQPALNKARATSTDDNNLRRLIFLDETLQGIIKRFEDEFPDTRESAEVPSEKKKQGAERPPSPSTAEDTTVTVSDGDDETEIHAAKPLSRSNSRLSKVLAEEEGRVHRAGHGFRSGVAGNTDVVNVIDDIGTDPNHVRVLTELAEDIGGELLELVKEKGAIRAFKEHKDLTVKGIKESDLEYWDTFVESQRKARANINLPETQQRYQTTDNDSAIAD
ncbi:hypothetical protein PT974_11558 [Cladobotryum mycophilum]|uniref:Cell wall biogenesis protein Mhp1 n=1 Tax=Cladobotryum mycophilum TaxID=491253 RepID=A0ABR0S5J6_9HYPO